MTKAPGTLAASLSTALAIETVGSLSPFSDEDSTLPSPRTYLATFVVWWTLALVASFGPASTRAASALGWLVVLVRLVTPPFGPKVIRTIDGFRRYFSESQAGAPAPPPNPGVASAGPPIRNR